LTSDGHFWLRQHLLWHTAVKYEMSMTLFRLLHRVTVVDG